MAQNKTNIAKDTIWPEDSNILVRTVFLHVGQGSSAVVFVADNDAYLVLLVDTNKDAKSGGINVPRMMKDLLDDDSLYAFVNTHPHDDHIGDVKELSEAITIDAVWHSNHRPSKKHGSKFKDLTALISKVEKAGGEILVLDGSRTPVSIGEAQYHVLAPAEHLTDDVNEEDADERYARIHEQCVVIKFGDGTNWHMNSGDADRAAFEQHIVPYHKKRLGAYVLAASHHGSRTFFRETEDEEDKPYMDGLNAINPTYIVISAPAQGDSPFDHPHDDAIETYEEKVGAENVFHTGKEKFSFIFDIYKDGTVSAPMNDEGKLAAEYGHTEDGDDKPTRGGYTPRTENTQFGGEPRRFA
jgi:competence protein ComEC